MEGVAGLFCNTSLEIFQTLHHHPISSRRTSVPACNGWILPPHFMPQPPFTILPYSAFHHQCEASLRWGGNRSSRTLEELFTHSALESRCLLEGGRGGYDHTKFIFLIALALQEPVLKGRLRLLASLAIRPLPSRHPFSTQKRIHLQLFPRAERR